MRTKNKCHRQVNTFFFSYNNNGVHERMKMKRNKNPAGQKKKSEINQVKTMGVN
jgi:hypothetical protein